MHIPPCTTTVTHMQVATPRIPMTSGALRDLVNRRRLNQPLARVIEQCLFPPLTSIFLLVPILHLPLFFLADLINFLVKRRKYLINRYRSLQDALLKVFIPELRGYASLSLLWRTRPIFKAWR